MLNDNDMMLHFQASPLRKTPFKVPSSQTTFTVTKLDAYKNYTFEVYAKNSLGSGPRSRVTVRTEETSKLVISCKVQ